MPESSDARPASDEERGRDLARITAFSDCVFSIAMTLLVVTLEIPDLGSKNVDEELRNFLNREWGQMLGFVLSFYVLARFWIAHHRLFRSVRFAAPRLIGLNLALLGFVAFLPYPSGIMGRYGETTTAAVFYAATMAATGLLSISVYEYAIRSGAVDPESDAARSHDLVDAALLPVIFVVSIPIAFVDAESASITWTLLLVTRWVRARRRAGPSGPAPKAPRAGS